MKIFQKRLDKIAFCVYNINKQHNYIYYLGEYKMRKDLILNENIKKERATFGERLKELRGFFEFTQAEIAEIMGVVPTTIIAYEKNQKNPSIDVALRVAEHFNISLDWLCGFTDTMTRIIPMTYADIFKKIIEIMDSKIDYCEIGEFALNLNYPDDDGLLDPDEKTQAIGFRDWKIQVFLKEYDKMHTLYKKGTIDNDLFNIWINKKLQQNDGEDNLLFGLYLSKVFEAIPYNE